jgi:hypothetical protein
MKRRRFLAVSAFAGFAGAVPASIAAAVHADRDPGHDANDATKLGAAAPPVKDGSGQRFHRDYISYREGLEYYVLGNGRIQCVLQTAATAEAGTHCGLFVMSPEHFSRKASTYLYHPERGAENTRFFVTVNGRGYVPEFATSRVTWDFPDGVPTLRIEWPAGDVIVVEQLTAPMGMPAIVRSVFLRNTGAAPVTVTARALLYPNLMLFDEYAVDREKRCLTTRGFRVLHLASAEATSAADRQLSFDFGSIPPGGDRSCTLVLSSDDFWTGTAPGSVSALRAKSGEFWRGTARIDTGDAGLEKLFNVSKAGIRAAVAWNGKMDGGIWQYNLEWVRDQSMVAVAAAMCGMSDPASDDAAPRLLERMLERSVDTQGGTVDSSRTRTPDMMELDQNGALLHALWTHWVWTGDDSLIKKNLSKITRVGEYLQKADFVDADSGLLKNSREYWERDARYGVREGFENSYQLWSIVGFEALADMTADIGGSASASQRWRDAARKLRGAFLTHPRQALVERGVLIKRRLPDGSVQRLFEPPNRASLPQGMPLATERESFCDPDTSCVLPIIHGIVDARGAVAKATLDAMETLWNQRWDGGGYGRYHVSSEPDSPGPWPFPSMFVARANLEAGNHDRVWRTLRWLMETQGGAGGAWWEFYGERPTPPLPPVGLVVWTWAEIVMFFIHHLVGARPQPSELILAPHLLDGLDTVRAELTLRGSRREIILRRTGGEERAVTGRRQFTAENGIFHLPYDALSSTIECHVR